MTPSGTPHLGIPGAKVLGLLGVNAQLGLLLDILACAGATGRRGQEGAQEWPIQVANFGRANPPPLSDFSLTDTATVKGRGKEGGQGLDLWRREERGTANTSRQVLGAHPLNATQRPASSPESGCTAIRK